MSSTRSKIRTSDAQFSKDEIRAVRREVQRASAEPHCPRCQLPLDVVAIPEPHARASTLSLLRCPSCRRFAVLPEARA